MSEGRRPGTPADRVSETGAAAAPISASSSGFIDPRSSRQLLNYFQSVWQWHGYVRFLGLPTLGDHPDLPIEELFVEPWVANRPVPLDRADAVDGDGVARASDAVVARRRLVLLGDPGSGKSTLVSWLAWRMTRSDAAAWQPDLARLIPFPMVLREMDVSAQMSWPSLVDAFLAQPVAEALDADIAWRLLRAGQAMVLVDGLDEIGSLEVRKALRESVWTGMADAPQTRWLLTSRVVGYDEVPFHEARRPSRPGEEMRFDWHAQRHGRWGPLIEGRHAAMRLPIDRSVAAEPELRVAPETDLAHVAPFSDEQIRSFARAWHAVRSPARHRARTGASDLVAAVTRDPAIHRLARVPNLLTLMAIVHRVRARLPHGRALLYEDIAAAYLQSIDEFRGIAELDEPLAVKKRWLARVGFEMQRRLTEDEASAPPAAATRQGSGATGALVVSGETVVAWLADAMAKRDEPASPEVTKAREAKARRFLDHVGRRSGLLLPRGPDRHAFTHLSFQEYFAALYLVDQILSPSWRREAPPGASLGASPGDLARHARDPRWREVLVFLFELLASREGWIDELCEILFRTNFQALRDEREEHAALLLARLTANPHSGLTPRLRRSAREACWRVALASRHFSSAREIPAALLASEDEQAEVFAALRVAWDPARPRPLSLDGSALRDLAALPLLLGLRSLSLDGTQVSDVSALGRLPTLEHLDLSGTQVLDVSALGSLPALEHLDLSLTQVSDVSALAGSSRLAVLDLSRTRVSDAGTLGSLPALVCVFLGGTQVSDVSALAGSFRLKIVSLVGTRVSDVSALGSLSALERLFLGGTQVSDVSALGRLPALKRLDLSWTRVSDVSALGSLPALEQLYLSGTQVSDVSALAAIGTLRVLIVSDPSHPSVQDLKRRMRSLQVFGAPPPAGDSRLPQGRTRGA